MSDIFYKIGIVIFILNFISLIYYKRIFKTTEWLFKYKKVTGYNLSLDRCKDKSMHRTLIFWSFTTVLTVLWTIFGLLSSNWIAFILLFIFNIIFNYTKLMLSNISKVCLIISFLKNLVCLTIIGYLIFNYFS